MFFLSHAWGVEQFLSRRFAYKGPDPKAPRNNSPIKLRTAYNLIKEVSLGTTEDLVWAAALRPFVTVISRENLIRLAEADRQSRGKEIDQGAMSARANNLFQKQSFSREYDVHVVRGESATWATGVMDLRQDRRMGMHAEDRENYTQHARQVEMSQGRKGRR